MSIFVPNQMRRGSYRNGSIKYLSSTFALLPEAAPDRTRGYSVYRTLTQAATISLRIPPNGSLPLSPNQLISCRHGRSMKDLQGSCFLLVFDHLGHCLVLLDLPDASLLLILETGTLKSENLFNSQP